MKTLPFNVMYHLSPDALNGPVSSWDAFVTPWTYLNGNRLVSKHRKHRELSVTSTSWPLFWSSLRFFIIMAGLSKWKSPRQVCAAYTSVVKDINSTWMLIYEIIHFELQVKDWIEERSWKLFLQLKQLRKESLKNIQAWTGFEPMTSTMPVHCSHNMTSSQLACTGIVEVMGSNPVQAWMFFYFQAFFSQLLNL